MEISTKRTEYFTFKLNASIFSVKFSLLPKTNRSSDAQNMFNCEILFQLMKNKMKKKTSVRCSKNENLARKMIVISTQ